MLSDGTGTRHGRSAASASHLECCTVIDAETMANDSYVTNMPCRPGERVALEPALAQMLAQHLHDSAVGRDAIIDRRVDAR